MFSRHEKFFLLSLARNSIASYLDTGKKLEINAQTLPSPKLTEPRGTFVTLHTIDGDLRGCIGKLESDEPLYQDIIDNAINAALRDPRFLPLSQSELNDIKIEISILTEPQLIKHTDTNDLLNKIKPKRDGIILKNNFYQSTFLPQVWEELSDKIDFLNHLSAKAGLASDAWQDGDVEFWKYQVTRFNEK